MTTRSGVAVPGSAAVPPVDTVPAVLRRAVGSRGRRRLLVVILAAGVLVVVAAGAGLPPADRTFGGYANPAQSVVSVVVPLLGVLLARDLRDRGGRAQVTPVGGFIVGAVIGACCGLVCALATALLPSAAADPWRHAGPIAVGGVFMQGVAVLVGLGLGLL